ncbi:MAG TPA: ABC transporter permease [Acidimicrobiales bacterium]|nr:ABC transporter permease [Acidimicrobiales bacterium]
MFYLTYLHRELRRRLGRTVLTVLGLAVGVSLVVLVSALSTGLDRAQHKILNPLAKVGTDLVVSRPVDVPLAGAGANAAVVGGVNDDEVNSLVDENQSLFQTDFSKLGKPGSTFERELFLPATQLTFPDTEVNKIAKLDGVDQVAGALSLLAVHQKGKVPEIEASVTTGGQQITQTQDIPAPSAAEWKAISDCIQQSGGGPSCLPARFRRLSSVFTTPREVIKQVLNPPQTDLATEPYTAAGVDASRPGLGLITPAQIVSGHFLDRTHTDEVVLGEGYARRKGYTVGGKLVLDGKNYTIVGFARPPLGGESADVYLPLSELQSLSGRTARVNTLLVRADNAADVPALTKSIQRAFPGASVTSAKDLANSISGSLVSAGTLANRLGLALGALAVFAAILIAVLLTLSSVAKRVRELGTLAALGWSKGLIIRQVLAESFAQGALGGIIGAVLGAAAAFGLTSAGISLHAAAATQAGPLSSSFGLGKVLSDKASEAILLTAPLKPMVLVFAVALAVGGGLVAGAAGALRAARLRPADALRELG